MENREEKKYELLSDDLIGTILNLSSGFLSAGDLDSLMSLLESEIKKYVHSPVSESNLLRVLNSLYDKINFFFDAIKYPHHMEILTAVAYNSNYLTDIIVRNPEFLYQLFNPSYLFENIETVKIRHEINEGINRYKTFNAKVNYLKSVKRRGILKIGVNDILRNIDLKEVTKQLSALAYCLNSELFSLCYSETLAKYKLAEEERYTLVGLGKLGGFELNYSSDVDFIIFYEKNYLIEGINKEYHELLTEAIHLFIKSASEITDKGFLYRTDFRLRPDGRNSPLCRTVGDYLKYYETRGEMWEKQMLIKLGFVGGDHKLYSQFFNYMQSYIFASTFSVSPLEVIKRMKSNIEKHASSKDDVKRFPGGIRDIEFAVQALQLLKGHEIIEIRTSNTLEALLHFERNQIINYEEFTVVSEAYVFYRRIEHYLQLMNDKQTHTIPSEGEIYDKLVNYMGFETKSKFESELKYFRNYVRKFYESVVGSADTETVEGDSTADRIEFKDKIKAERNLSYLKSGTGLLGQKGFDSRTIELFGNIEFHLLSYLNKSITPDRVLENLTRIVSAVKIPSIWYSEFKNEIFFHDFLTLCEFSQKAIDNFAFDLSVGDLILSRKILSGESEQLLSDLNTRQFNSAISCRFGLKLIDEDAFSKNIHRFTSGKLTGRLETLGIDPGEYFLAGLGSFGTEDMTFSSDLDLIVVAKNISVEPDLNRIFRDFLADIKKNLNPYEVDFRLRPEGKHSPLVWDIESYQNYLNSRASIWEFQALTKLRFVHGNHDLFERFKEIVLTRLREIGKESIKSEVVSMNKKIHANFGSRLSGAINLKYSLGGMVDIDNIAQYLILNNPEHYRYCLELSNSGRMEYLSEIFSGISNFGEISNIYRSFKKVTIALQNIFNINKPIFPNDAEKQLILANFFGMSFDQLFKETTENLKSGRRFYTEIVGGAL